MIRFVARAWRRELLSILQPLVDHIDVKCAEAGTEFHEWKMVEDQAIMAESLVIGMTTSYAASRQRILKELKPQIGVYLSYTIKTFLF